VEKDPRTGETLVENAFLVGLSQQVATHRTMDVIANNIANMATPGFKRESLLFEEYVVEVPANEAEGPGTVDVSFVLDVGTARDLNSGRLENTGVPTDVAINGAGYFVVQTPEGERYTRNGHFHFDPTGRLVTDDGHAVLSQGGEIAVRPEDGAMHISADGTISTALGVLGRLRIVTFENERALMKAGASLYTTGEGQAGPQNVEQIQVAQGTLERSNVEPVIEIARMVQVMRAYQANLDITQTSQDLLRRAIEKLGAVPQG
jgi:flagellar basal-body rod protein FlgF